MSENRIIGDQAKIPWHLPEDFKWFKEMTSGQLLIMGRKTFEAIGRPLPNRTTIVLSRSRASIPGVRTIQDLDEIDWLAETREVFICGGAQVYAQTLPRCSDLYLTLVKRVVTGDTSFPPFEHLFEPAEILRDGPEFRITHYRNKTLSTSTRLAAERRCARPKRISERVES
jgi:dihydrofolate reductase